MRAEAILRAASLWLLTTPCCVAAFPLGRARSPRFVRAFGTSSAPRRRKQTSIFEGKRRSLKATRNERQPAADSVESSVREGGGRRGHPVRVRHQGRVATIFAYEGEPILQALERQSTFSTYQSAEGGDCSPIEAGGRASSSLALSQIPHECRRGNCLTCSSRIVPSGGEGNVRANVDNGLSPAVSSELTESGYVLTCCSYVTGPGVELELDQNDRAWDLVYRRRLGAPDAQRSAVEARARLLRRVDEGNAGDWKRRLERNWERGGEAD